VFHMVAKAIHRFARISPFKVRPVIPLVKGADVSRALNVLSLLPQKGAYLLRKVVASAAANAKQKGHDVGQLYISRILADQGPVLKRFRAASFGRGMSLLKRTSHILVELDSRQKLVPNVTIKAAKPKKDAKKAKVK